MDAYDSVKHDYKCRRIRKMGKKYVTLVICAAILFLSVVGTASARTWYVDDDGGADFTGIQEAVNMALPGDTIIVYNGTYTENVEVSKPLTIRTSSGDPEDTFVQAANSNNHVFVVTADYVNISGFTIKGATGLEDIAGIYLNSVDYGNISDNTATGNTFGFFMHSSGNNTLMNNTAYSNNYGIIIFYSCNNTLRKNTVNSNDAGGIVVMLSSNNNTLTNNTAYSNSNSGFQIAFSCDNRLMNNIANSNDFGISLNSLNNNTLTNNTANSNNDFGILISFSCNNTITDNTANSNKLAGIGLRSSSNNTITDNIANSNILTGFLLTYSSNNTITSNNVDSNNDFGIFMSSSNYNTITCNTANYNYFEIGSSGILINSSNYNTLTDNTFNSNSIGIKLNSSSYNILTNNTFNSNTQTGIDLHYSNYNTIINNTAFLNNLGGILLDYSNYNAITNNTFNSNKQTGIGLHYSNYNTLTKNSACMNNASGILLAYSRHNLIYLNNFINNGDNFLLFGSLYFDTWNSTEEIAYRYNETTYTHHLGNYWSDYKGTDENEDGIGDTPYSLESDKDNHPLMEPLENYLVEQTDLIPTPMPEQKTWHFVVFFSGSESGETPSFNITGDEWRVKWVIEPSSSWGLLFTASARRFSPFSEYVGFWTSVASWEWDSGSPYDGIQYIYEGKGRYSFKVSCMFVDNWLLTVEDYY